MNIDNVTVKLGDDLKKSLNSSSKINLCAAYFSIYAFKELKKELSKIKEFNFLFNSPTFLKEEMQIKSKKNFLYLRLSEKNLLQAENMK